MEVHFIMEGFCLKRRGIYYIPPCSEKEDMLRSTCDTSR